MTLVVDASVAAKWFIAEAGRAQALQVLDLADRHAPDLLLVEVANVVWKKALGGQVTAAQARLICASVAHCFDVLHSSQALMERAMSIALTLRHPIYDCLYLACAERAGARLATADRRLMAAVRGSAFAPLILDLDDLGQSA